MRCPPKLCYAVALVTVLGVFFSLYAQPLSAKAAAAQHQDVILVVGRLAQCADSTTQLPRHTTTAATIDASCSLRLDSTAADKPSWQPGQQLSVTGLNTLDCLVHAQAADYHGADLFVLTSSTGTGSSSSQQLLQVVEHVQLPLQHRSDDSSNNNQLPAITDLLQQLLGTALPASCVAALNSNNNNRQLPAESASAQQDAYVEDDLYLDAPSNRQLLQAPATNSSSTTAAPTATGSNTTAAASRVPLLDTVNSTASPLTTTASLISSALQADNGTLSFNSTTAREVCALLPETGRCRARFPRWAWDVPSGACREFVWGGCDGNANNFPSQQACEDACAELMLLGGDAAAEIVMPEGPVAATVDAPRVLTAGNSPAPAPTSSRAGDRRSLAEQLLRVGLAGVVAGLTVLLL